MHHANANETNLANEENTHNYFRKKKKKIQGILHELLWGLP